MKKIVFVASILVFTVSVSAQKLIDIYKAGTVKLVPDTEYAQGNNWDKVFETYYDTIYKKPMGNRKSLVVLPDGSVVVNHSYRNYYTIFSPDGIYEKEAGIKNKDGQRLNRKHGISGIINDTILHSGPDNAGNMICCDLNGNYIKTLKLDYRVRQKIPLPNNKIAVVGWTIWSTKFRDFVAIVDYETNKEKIIWDHFTERGKTTGKRKPFNYQYSFDGGHVSSFSTMPIRIGTGMSLRPRIAYIQEKLVIAIPSTGRILMYDLDGNLMPDNKTNMPTKYISVEEQKAIQQKAIDKYGSIKNPMFYGRKVASPEEEKQIIEENRQAWERILSEMKADLEKISDPFPFPSFSVLIQDSDGNLLFFEFPEENDANKFNVWVYENGGRFVCQSSFVCDEYILNINPSKMVFHNGYIYGLQHIKDAKGVPLRLVRFKVTSN